MRLTEVIARPFKTARRILRLVKDVELVPVVGDTVRPAGWEKTAKQSTVYARIDSTHILIPYDLYKQLEPYIVRLDYDYIGTKRHWKLHSEKQVVVQAVHVDDLTAMQVVKKLET